MKDNVNSSIEYQDSSVQLVKADCLDWLKTVADNSVDLIATDPPYYKVKTAEWDRQWPTKANFFEWLDAVLDQFERVVKPTGTLYLFCNPYLGAETELLIGQRFNVLNHIVWRKPQGRWLGCNKESLTKYFPQTERIIFAGSKKRQEFHYESIRRHLVKSIKSAGISSKQVNQATGTKMSGHWFGRSQFAFPSRENYQILRRLAPTLKPYDKLRAEYIGIRGNHGRSGRYFAVTKHVPYTDVWDFSSVHPYPGKHPCQKPAQLMEHIINTSSRPGGVVLDAFVGSGSTPLACRKLGRQFIGCEMGDSEFSQAVDRLTR